jgi:hypothetical protein
MHYCNRITAKSIFVPLGDVDEKHDTEMSARLAFLYGWLSGSAWRSTDIALVWHCDPIALFRIGLHVPRKSIDRGAILMYIEISKIVLAVRSTPHQQSRILAL